MRSYCLENVGRERNTKDPSQTRKAHDCVHVEFVRSIGVSTVVEVNKKTCNSTSSVVVVIVNRNYFMGVTSLNYFTQNLDHCDLRLKTV